VDNPESKENVRRFAVSQGCDVSVKEEYLEIAKGRSGEGEERPETEAENIKNADVVCITSDRFGTGDEELGEILMKAFLNNTLWDYRPRPARLLFINNGVMLTTEGSETLDALKLLEEEGVGILSCGTCIDYYGIKDKLRVGRVTNMYETVDTLLTSGKVVNI